MALASQRATADITQLASAASTAVFDAMSQGVLIVDPALRVLYINAAVGRMMHCAVNQLIGRDASTCISPAYRERFLQTLRDAGAERDTTIFIDVLAITIDGSEIAIKINCLGAYDQLAGSHVLLLTDQTERRIAVQQTTFLHTFFDTTLDIMHHLDLRAVLDSLTVQAARLFNTPDSLTVLFEEAALTFHYMGTRGLWTGRRNMLHRLDTGVVGEIWRTSRPVLVNDYDHWSGRRQTITPSLVATVMGAPIMHEGRAVGAIIVTRSEIGATFAPEDLDQLARLAALASVAYTNAQLYNQARSNEQELDRRVQERTRELSQALSDIEQLREQTLQSARQAAAQIERARLARELHDSVSQAVYGIALGARTIQDSGALDKAPEAAEPLEYILKLADAALAEMRALIFELRPDGLANAGLCMALARHAEAMRARYELTVTLSAVDEPECAFAIKEALYRITLEALHNIVKHARARAVGISLELAPNNRIRLCVRDDGIGFAPTQVAMFGLGLKSMNERATELGGTIEIASMPDHGTTVTVYIPSA